MVKYWDTLQVIQSLIPVSYGPKVIIMLDRIHTANQVLLSAQIANKQHQGRVGGQVAISWRQKANRVSGVNYNIFNSSCFDTGWLKTASKHICESLVVDKKVVYELWNHLLRLALHTHTKVMSSVLALLRVTNILPLLYQPCVNQRGELKRFSYQIWDWDIRIC